MLYEINEHDEFDLAVSFYDSAGALTAPTSISYRIDAADGTEIRDYTSVSPSSSISIRLNYTDNSIVDDTLEFEDHLVTVTATYGTGADGKPRQKTDQFRYQVKNLSVVS